MFGKCLTMCSSYSETPGKMMRSLELLAEETNQLGVPDVKLAIQVIHKLDPAIVSTTARQETKIVTGSIEEELKKHIPNPSENLTRLKTLYRVIKNKLSDEIKSDIGLTQIDLEVLDRSLNAIFKILINQAIQNKATLEDIQRIVTFSM